MVRTVSKVLVVDLRVIPTVDSWTFPTNVQQSYSDRCIMEKAIPVCPPVPFSIDCNDLIPPPPSTGCWRCSCPVQPRGSHIWPAGECYVCWSSSCLSSSGSWWLGHLLFARTRTGSWLSSTWATRLTGCSSVCACWIAGTTWWLSVSLTTALCLHTVLWIDYTVLWSVHTAVREHGLFEVFMA